MIVKKNDSSNPIVTFCDVHRATDNFATGLKISHMSAPRSSDGAIEGRI